MVQYRDSPSPCSRHPCILARRQSTDAIADGHVPLPPTPRPRRHQSISLIGRHRQRQPSAVPNTACSRRPRRHQSPPAEHLLEFAGHSPTATRRSWPLGGRTCLDLPSRFVFVVLSVDGACHSCFDRQAPWVHSPSLRLPLMTASARLFSPVHLQHSGSDSDSISSTHSSFPTPLPSANPAMRHAQPS